MPPSDRAVGAVVAYTRLVHRLTTAGAVLAGTAIAAVVLILNHMILIRTLGDAVVWHVELGVYLTIAAFFLGAPYVVRTRGDVAVDLLANALPAAWRDRLRLAIYVVMLATCAYLAWAGAGRTLDAFRSDLRSISLWGPKLWPVYGTMPLGLSMTCLQIVAEILAILAALRAAGEVR